MGMMPAFFNSVNTSNKRTKVKRKPGWQQREAEHRAFLKKHGIDPDAKPKKKREFKPMEKTSEPYRRETKDYPSCSNNIGGIAAKRESQKYTGTLIKGVATMHKSNAVPIIDKQQAIDIADMGK